MDPDFNGSLTDFRVYKAGLTQDEVIEVMCESLTDGEIVQLAKDKYLSFPITVVTKDVSLPSSLMGGKVSVSWNSSNQAVLSNEGVVGDVTIPKGVTLTAILNKGDDTTEKIFLYQYFLNGFLHTI